MSDAKTPPELSIDEILATIRRIIADDEQTSGTATVGDPVKATGEKTTAEKAADDDDVLELTEALNEDGTTRHLAPIGGGAVRRPAASGETPPAAPRVEPQLRLRPALQPEPQRRDAPSLRLTPAQQSAGQNEPGLPRDLSVGGGDRTLEDIVRDTLRPLLQAWLDEHLPPLVERLVQAEIAKVGRDAGSA